MNLNIESIIKNRAMGRKRLISSLTGLGTVVVIFYIYIWGIAPTSPLARLPNCIGGMVLDTSRRLDASDGRISGTFATEPQNMAHFAGYSFLQFSETGLVSEYSVADQIGVMSIRRALLWIALYKYPSFSPKLKPPEAGSDFLVDRNFFVFSPETAIYIIDGEKINFVLYEIDEGMDFTKHWEGTISGENLVFKVYDDGWEREEVYSYINYDTCPIGEK